MNSKKVLLVVDIQNDFCPGGALAVPGGDKIIPAINRHIRDFLKAKLPVFFSRDWHPKRTMHFKKFGGVWPKHCIRGTKGARFHPKLKLPKGALIMSKGMDPKKDSYSAFQAKDANGVSLLTRLKALGIKQIYIAGIATDYCVKYSALDALRHGFKVRVLADAIKGIDLKPGDSIRSLKQIVKAGARIIYG